MFCLIWGTPKAGFLVTNYNYPKINDSVVLVVQFWYANLGIISYSRTIVHGYHHNMGDSLQKVLEKERIYKCDSELKWWKSRKVVH